MIVERLKERVIDTRDILKAIIIFGSAVRKEKPRDIDVLIILDDKAEDIEKAHILEKYKSNWRELEEKEGMEFHFQDPMRISELWIHLIKAEPWTVTAIDQGIAIYDPENIVPVLKKFVKGLKYVFKERAEKLVDRARKAIERVDELKMQMIKNIGEIAIESAKMLLLLDKKIIFDEKRIVKEMKENYRDVLGDALDDFLDVIMIYEKILDKKLLDVKMVDIKRLKEKLERFVDAVQKIVLKRLSESGKGAKGNTK